MEDSETKKVSIRKDEADEAVQKTSDKDVSDKEVSDKEVSDKEVSDKKVSDKKNPTGKKEEQAEGEKPEDLDVEEYNRFVWRIVDEYFASHPKAYVQHHIDSYNHFLDSFVQQTFQERNPVVFQTGYDEATRTYKHTLRLYFGGRDGKRIYFGKPVIYDKNREHYMFPNEARLRNMTYGATIHYDLDIEYEDVFDTGDETLYPDPAPLGNLVQTTFARAALSETVVEDYTTEIAADVQGRPGSEAFRESVRRQNEELERLSAQGLGEPVLEEVGEPSEKALQGSVYDAEGQTEKFSPEGQPSVHAEGQPSVHADDEKGQQGGGPKRKPTPLMTLAAAPQTLIEAQRPPLGVGTRNVSAKVVATRRVQRRQQSIDRILLGRMPMMLQSKYCVLYGLPPHMRQALGECKNEPGGYFLIDGKEKCIIPQEKFADNMILLKRYEKVEEVDAEDEVGVGAVEGGQPTYTFSAEIRSVSENVSKPIRTLRVGLVHPTTTHAFQNIVVELPNVRSPVPLFVVFRALGILSDRAIIETCLLDLEKYAPMIDPLVPSVHDASMIYTQSQAIHFISLLLKHKSEKGVHKILTDFLFPHIGESNYQEKALFLGHMVFRLLSVSMGLEPPTDRDHYACKRVESTGILLSELFRHAFAEEQKVIRLGIETIYNYQKEQNQDLANLITNNYRKLFAARECDQAIRRAFKGRWGEGHERRVGVVQDLNRLSFLSAMSHLRKINLPIDSSVKLVGPRVLSGNSWGFLDPIDTPDGASVGLHKTMATLTLISQSMGRQPIVDWVRAQPGVHSLQRMRPADLATLCKIFVNGYWCASTSDPVRLVETFKDQRRLALIPYGCSCQFSVRQRSITIYTDGGRLLRPVFYSLGNRFSQEELFGRSKTFPTWTQMMMGRNEWKLPQYDPTRVYNVLEAYQTEDMASLLPRRAVLEYIDPSESENALICMNYFHPDKAKHNRWTHCEIHESLLYGVMSSLVLFLEHNPVARDSFSCSQSKQAVSLYHSNYGVRLDKTGLVLNGGQIPLVKTRFYRYICQEEHPYGENAMVAIMSYTGYNVEDSILVSRGALERGLFRTTYYSTYELHEEEEIRRGQGLVSGKGAKRTIGDRVLKTVALNVLKDPTVVGMKPGYDYSYLDERGLVREGTVVHDKMILIGMVAMDSNEPSSKRDQSKAAKKGQLGVVDKAFITTDEEGHRIIKIRIREQRQPNLGDKLAGRAGQKGTVGLILDEGDMPTTASGVRPDLIINPHAIPSRMTIGQLVEAVLGKVSVLYGGFSDCTAFNVRGNKIAEYGTHLANLSRRDLQEELRTYGFHSSGNEVMYNGMTGEQCEADIFFGPMYYMRLKHMVKDKINFRADGPNNALTRQPVGGRANDGGLRIGEMERDSVASHGLAYFLKESMMERADKYFMAVCQTTGFIAICNPDAGLWLSPAADGPVQFDSSWSRQNLSQSYVKQVSRFGRTFSLVEIPYALKLLIQEMMAANVSMRIVTEESLSQQESMGFRTDNVAKLTGLVEPVSAKAMEDLVKAVAEGRKELAEGKKAAFKATKTALDKKASPLSPSKWVPYQSPEWTMGPDQVYPPLPEGTPPPPMEGYPSPSYSPIPSPTFPPTASAIPSPTFPPNASVESSPKAPSPEGTPPDWDKNYSPGSQPIKSNYVGGGAKKVQFSDVPLRINPSVGPTTAAYPTFAIGTQFYLRGDSKPNRVWTLTKPGDKFMRIESNDAMGLPEGKDIRVVSAEDIVPVDSLPETGLGFPTGGIYPPPVGIPQPVAGPMQTPVNNNIEIHVVQGDDKSQKVVPAGAGSNPMVVGPQAPHVAAFPPPTESTTPPVKGAPIVVQKVE